VVTSPRIRWEPVTATTIAVCTGHVGTYPGHAFVIYSPEHGKTGLTVTCQLPGQQHQRYIGDRIAELKAVAEHWLEEHVAQFGAVFGAGASPELAALRDERHRLLALAAEILGSFERHCAAPYCCDRSTEVLDEQYEDWRERAGLEPGEPRTEGEPR
jgi:hypothetical protein